MPSNEKPQLSGVRGKTDAPLDPGERCSLIADARAMLIRRKKRELFFNPALFAEPAWDVLLLLYAFSAGDGTCAVDEVLELVSAPATTICRWLSILEDEELIERQSGTDGSGTLLRLTPMGQAKLDVYFGCGV